MPVFRFYKPNDPPPAHGRTFRCAPEDRSVRLVDRVEAYQWRLWWHLMQANAESTRQQATDCIEGVQIARYRVMRPDLP